MHIQGPHTRFPLAGVSKRQGCASHSTPEAEIVAADYAMSRIGIPAITLWRLIGGKDPNFVFYDDNQTMIGVVRTGKNPTMRHLERSHGICIAWMHEVFQEGYVSLAYEVTAKMAADIHTKAFKDHVSWAHACQLINIMPPTMLSSVEVMDMMKATHQQSADEKGHQHYSFKNEVPCFPYTQTPILPQELYRAGLSSKEGVQETDSTDPILVAKFPRMLRGVPSALRPGKYLRSTWILREGQWHRIEDEVPIPSEPQKFDRYVERAVFQYHFQRGSAATTRVHRTASPAVSAYPLPDCSRCRVRDSPALCRQVCDLVVRAAHGGYGGVFRAGSEGMGGDINEIPALESTVVAVARAAKEADFPQFTFVPEFIEVTRAGTGNHEVVFQDKHGKEMFKARSDSLSGATGFSMTIKASDIENSSPRVWLLVGLEDDNWWQTYAPPDVNIVCVPEADARGAYQYCKDIY